jgi:hypothetical protein
MQFLTLFCYVFLFWGASVEGFSGADDRYIKKYAMMKVSAFHHASFFFITAPCYILTAKKSHLYVKLRLTSYVVNN